VRRYGLSVSHLRGRLERLRDTCLYLQCNAKLGRELRRMLSEAGSPVWTPAEDLSWRTWIGRHGDENARALLAEIDTMLEERAAEIEAAGELASGAPSPAGKARS